MFYSSVDRTKFSGEIADIMFPHIKAHDYMNDVTLVTTLRVLLAGRLPENDKVSFRYVGFYGEFIDGEKLPSEIYADGYTTSIVSFESDEETVNKCFSLADSELNGIGFAPDYANEAMQKVLKFRMAIYVKEEQKKSVVLVERMDMCKWHLIQSFIPRFLPWYFPFVQSKNKREIDPQASKIIEALMKPTPDDYIKAIEAEEKSYDFETPFVRKSLSGFETNHLKVKVESVRRKIEAKNYEINDLRRKFAEIFRNIDALQIEELGLNTKIANGGEEDELRDYFLANRNLHLIDARDGWIKFYVTTALKNYDPDMYENIRNNEYSWLHRSCEFKEEQAVRLMDAIFMEERYSLLVCAAFRLNFSTGEYGGISEYEFDSSTLSNYLPNQHIQRYHCLGGNEAQIYECVLAHNYIGAVIACEAAAANINFNDTTVGDEFARRIYNKRATAFLRDETTGELLTPAQVVEILDKEAE